MNTDKKRTVTLTEDEQIAIRIALRAYLDAWESQQPGEYASPVYLYRGSNIAFCATALNRLMNVAHGMPETYKLERTPKLRRPVVIAERAA
jgi:hypothetical protein